MLRDGNSVSLGFLPGTLALCLFGLLLVENRAAPGAPEPSARYVGQQTCASCHRAESAQWKTSHHALAMQKASDGTVLGDFNGAAFEHFGVTTTFSRAGDKFMVRTDGPDGTLHDYEVAYTFGVYPLQQYLIAMPGGRYQALGVAWDSRPKDQGGQRWFHLYPDRKLAAGDRLHWTGRDQTWNYMCADCHSTDLRKNYDLTSDTYATTWSDIDVSCEACHGPGSRHVAWAEARASAGAALSEDPRKGLVTWLKATDQGRWEMNPETGIARRTEPRTSSAELEACAGCHSRRATIAQDAGAGTAFLDTHLPALLMPGLYHADGQIDGEVFEYGSFIQSRMYRAGVTCTDCHAPHSLALRAEGNALCAQCHLPAKFDVAEHHHHEPDGAGAQCVNCHMPAKTYMVVHERRDHSFRVPRPDLTKTIGVPNTCNQCHADKTPEWAAQAVARWYPGGRQTKPHYGVALHAGRTAAVGAERLLDELIAGPDQPAIARASALLLLPGLASAASVPAYGAAISDSSPLVRSAAARALPAAPSAAMVRMAAPLLRDPVRSVRVEAARALAGVDPQALTPEQRSAFSVALMELWAAEMSSADRAEAHLNLGLLQTRRGQPDEAEAQYRTALRLEPDFVPALVNLADLERARGRDQDGVGLLRQASRAEPNNAEAHHALGLLLVRQRKYAEALPELRDASDLAPDNARYAYVYAVALNSTGAPTEALASLERAHAAVSRQSGTALAFGVDRA